MFDNFNAVSLLGRQISIEHVDFKAGEDSQLTDPPTRVPAPLRTDMFALPNLFSRKDQLRRPMMERVNWAGEGGK
jgi:hypothetical protein